MAREGYPLIAVGIVLTVLLWLMHWPLLSGVAGLLAAFIVSFFRDPERAVPPGEHRIVSPADGRVITVRPEQETRFLGAPVTKISIFMSPLNVHVNRTPTAGTIERVVYNKGKYFRAYADKASLDNEQNAIVMRDRAGRRLCFVQIAGFLARRIVCYFGEAMSVERGERCGIIMFGSRADVYLPTEAVVRVAVGDRVRGGETVLAEWPS